MSAACCRLSIRRLVFFEISTVIGTMSIGCGASCTAVVTLRGQVFSWGKGPAARRPTAAGTPSDSLGPGSCSRVVVLAAGDRHFAAVTEDGKLHTWGEGEYCQLGHGDRLPRLGPASIVREVFSCCPVESVACGSCHTLAVTVAGSAWTCGSNGNGQVWGHLDAAAAMQTNIVVSNYLYRDTHPLTHRLTLTLTFSRTARTRTTFIETLIHSHIDSHSLTHSHAHTARTWRQMRQAGVRAGGASCMLAHRDGSVRRASQYGSNVGGTRVDMGVWLRRPPGPQ